MRVLHFSDIHLPIPWDKLPWTLWLGKRALGGLNSRWRRSQHFADANTKLACLAQFVKQEAVELVISTGDHTQLGTEPEYALARRALEPFMEAPRGFMQVPGNHDLYLSDTVTTRRFERHFPECLLSDEGFREVSGEPSSSPWPVIRLVSPGVAVVAVNSARPNPQPWRSSGHISNAQLTALDRALQNPELQNRFVFLITHYAPLLENGNPDTWSHGLTNTKDFIEVCGRLRRGAILHGHIHRGYRVRHSKLAVPILGAGSATYAGRECFWLFDVDRDPVTVGRGVWTGTSYEVTADEPI